MLPEISQLEFKIQTETSPIDLGKSFLFDFQTGDFVITNGKLVPADGTAALKIWIEKILRTEKQSFKIYAKNTGKDEYGVHIEDLIFGNKYPAAFLEAELKREISSSLLRHPQIESLSNWRLARNADYLNVSFRVNLINGTNLEQEVSF